MGRLSKAASNNSATFGSTAPVCRHRRRVIECPWGHLLVSQITHYKERTIIRRGPELVLCDILSRCSAGHEFYVLVARDCHGVEKVFRIDRRPNTKKGLSSDVVTYDSITILDSDPSFDPTLYYHLRTITCTMTLTILKVCQICRTINETAPMYSLIKTRHCYWYCAAFMVLLRKFGYVDTEEQGPDCRERARWRSIKVIREKWVERQLREITTVDKP